jgi:hypothetical protein
MARDKQPADDSPPLVPVRLWPIVAAGALLWLIRFGIPIFMPGATLDGVIGGVVGAVARSSGGRPPAGHLGPSAGAPLS